MNKIKNTNSVSFKKLVALNLLLILTVGISGCCINKKPENSAQKTKIQLDTSDIDASKAFFVTPRGKKTNDGSSWQKAKDLQSAINAAHTNSNKRFVLVAQGSYYADPAKANELMSFELKNEVKVYGGFDTSSSGLKRYKDTSILEGKLSSDFNSKRILTGTNLSANTVLDGFLIQNALSRDDGTSINFPQDLVKGAALFLDSSSPHLNNLTFHNNKLTGSLSGGGAIGNRNSNPSISNSSFSNNSAKFAGGAIFNLESNPKISNSSFSYNSADSGGAVYNSESNPIINKSSFSNNSADSGGAISNTKSNPKINNSSFSKNSARAGGAINNFYESNSSIKNTIFGNNSAKYAGGAIFNNENSSPNISNSSFSQNLAKYGGVIFNSLSSPKIYNSILWNNKDKHKGTDTTNNIYNTNTESKPLIKNSILNKNSAVTMKSGQYDNKVTTNYDFMNFNKTEFSANQITATFRIDVQGRAPSGSQYLIKDKGDNLLYKEVAKREANSDKDFAGNSRLKGSKIDIGAYEIQQ